MNRPADEEDIAFVRALIAKAVSAGADEAQATLTYDEGLEVDFDSRRLSMLRSTRGDNVRLTVFKETRKGSAGISSRSGEAVDAATAEALAIANAAPPDPANGIAVSPPLPAAAYGDDAADKEQLIDAARAHIEEMPREHPAIITRNAYHRFHRTRRSFANSAGVSRQETAGRYDFVTMFAARRNGYATSLNYHGVSSYAPFIQLSKAGALPQLYGYMEASFDPRPAPGKFIGDVIVTPDALGNFVIGPLLRALGGYSLMAGTSPYCDRRGQLIASPSFSLLNRPAPGDSPGGAGFDGHGLPSSDLDVIRDGVLKEFLVDLYISRKLGVERTMAASRFVMPPGEKPLAQIVSETKRGILLARFSGGAVGSNLEFSGIAKNAFYVEDGKIQHPLTETMISGSLRDLIGAIRDVSRETVNFGSSEYPAIAAQGVTIAGK
jgi:PmbA protein